MFFDTPHPTYVWNTIFRAIVRSTTAQWILAGFWTFSMPSARHVRNDFAHAYPPPSVGNVRQYPTVHMHSQAADDNPWIIQRARKNPVPPFSSSRALSTPIQKLSMRISSPCAKISLSSCSTAVMLSHSGCERGWPEPVWWEMKAFLHHELSRYPSRSCRFVDAFSLYVTFYKK